MQNTAPAATVGDIVLILERGAVIGGGLVVEITGREIAIAQEVDYTIGADMAEDVVVRSEIVVERHTLSRTVKAVVR